MVWAEALLVVDAVGAVRQCSEVACQFGFGAAKVLLPLKPLQAHRHINFTSHMSCESFDACHLSHLLCPLLFDLNDWTFALLD